MNPRPRVAFAMYPQLIDELFPAAALASLRTHTDIISTVPATPADTSVLADAELVLTGWGAPQLTADVLHGAPNLRAVVHCAGSVKGFATSEMFQRGIRVTSAAWVNALPVAQYTLAAILNAGKHLPGIAHAFRDVRDGWSPTLLPAEMGNFGRTVGVIGASRVGRRLLEMLRGHDFEVLLADEFVTDAEAIDLGARKVSLDDLCASASIVSLHAPALPSTYRMIDARRLALMPDGATFINTARGSLVDPDALEAELVSDRLHAVLDVTEPEPLPADSPLYELPNVILTPHVAGSAGNEMARIGLAAIDEVERYRAGLEFVHRVDEVALSNQA